MRSCSWTNFTSQSRIASAFNELRSTHTVPSTFSARLFRSAAWRYSYSPNSCGCSRSQLTKYRLKSWALCHGSRIRQSIGSFSGGSDVSEVLGEKGTVLQNGIDRLHQLRYGFFFRNISSNADLPPSTVCSCARKESKSACPERSPGYVALAAAALPLGCRCACWNHYPDHRSFFIGMNL